MPKVKQKISSEILAERIRAIREIKEMLEQKEYEMVLSYQDSQATERM